jgi:hypothetical protein
MDVKWNALSKDSQSALFDIIHQCSPSIEFSSPYLIHSFGEMRIKYEDIPKDIQQAFYEGIMRTKENFSSHLLVCCLAG